MSYIFNLGDVGLGVRGAFTADRFTPAGIISRGYFTACFADSGRGCCSGDARER